jgi:cob(I)alamin adenosyltransferase
MRVTTKTGDQGTSGLANGKRLSKDDLVFEVLGTIDELSSWLGLVVVKLDEKNLQYRQNLFEIQKTLFRSGAEVAGSVKTKLTTEDLYRLEKLESMLEVKLGDRKTTGFILPGGSESAALLDIARTVCRRSERCLVRLGHKQKLSPLLYQYLNRLSDYLYLLRASINKEENIDEREV